MLGNKTPRTELMTKTVVVQPSIGAFKPESQAGCPDAIPATRYSPVPYVPALARRTDE
eukprot:COSAG02_NODE_5557_length_4231_cov_1.573572_3_plen_58_part_00